MYPNPSIHQAVTPTVWSLMRENQGASAVFPYLLIAGTVVLTFVSPVTSPRPGSMQTFHKCLLDKWRLNRRQRFRVCDSCEQKRTLTIQSSSSHHLESEDTFYWGLANKVYIHRQSNNLTCWYKNQINILFFQILLSLKKFFFNFSSTKSYLVALIKGSKTKFCKAQTWGKWAATFLLRAWVLLLTKNLPLKSKESPSKRRSRNRTVINPPPHSGSQATSCKPAPDAHCILPSALLPADRHRQRPHGIPGCREDIYLSSRTYFPSFQA